jgi:hypothetical protein
MPGQNQSDQYDPTWIDNATPEQLVEAGKRIVSKIGGLGEDYRQQFTDGLKGDQRAAKLMQHPLETAQR